MSNIAYVFPGQGSQKLGMLKDFYDEFSIVKDTFDTVNNSLNLDLWDIIQNDNEKLSQTEYTQPAILAASIAIFRLLESLGAKKPTILAGHSLGEYSAFVCANSLSLEDGVKLVRARGKIMQEAVPSGIGAMSAILGLSDEIVQEVCEEAKQSQVLDIANFNSVGQIVISGNKEAIERANILAKSKGAKRAQILPVSVPSHSLLMKDGAIKLKNELDKINFKKPEINVIQNVDVNFYTDIEEIKKNLVLQLYSSVHWTDTVKKINTLNYNTVLECGYGKVLSGLNKRIVKTLNLFNTTNMKEIEKFLNN